MIFKKIKLYKYDLCHKYKGLFKKCLLVIVFISYIIFNNLKKI